MSVTPSRMKLSPSPSTIPRTTGRLVRAATQVTRPLTLNTSHAIPVAAAAIHTAPGVTSAPCAMATVRDGSTA